MVYRTLATRVFTAACLACLLGCKSVPTPIDTNKTDGIAVETIVNGKDLEKTIDDIKTITEDAKNAGVIAKKDTPRVIEYVDKSARQVKQLNAQLLSLEKSRKDDNKKMGDMINSQAVVISTLKSKYEAARLALVVSFAVNIVLLILIVGYIIIKVKKLLPI